MKKLFIIVALILVLATGCTNRKTPVSSAPTVTPAGETNKPTENTPTPTVTTTPTATTPPTATATPSATPASVQFSLKVIGVDAQDGDAVLIDAAYFNVSKTAQRGYTVANNASLNVKLEAHASDERKFVGWYEDANCEKTLASDAAFDLQLTAEQIKKLEKTIYVKFESDDTSKVSESDIDVLQQFVGTTAIADLFEKVYDLGYKCCFTVELDKQSTSPWGTILKIEKSSDSQGELVKIIASANGKHEGNKLAKEYSEDELNKTKIETVTLGVTYSDKFTRRQGNMELPYEAPYYDIYLAEKLSEVYKYCDSEYNENGELIRRIKYYDNNECVIEEVTYLEKKEYTNIYGLGESGTVKFRVDYYSATNGKSSDEKKLIAYEIFVKEYEKSFNLGGQELWEDDSRFGDALDLLFPDSYVPYIMSSDSGKLFRADGSLQSTVDGNDSSLAFSAESWDYVVKEYDANGKQVNEAICDGPGGVDFVILVDRYGQKTIKEDVITD